MSQPLNLLSVTVPGGLGEDNGDWLWTDAVSDPHDVIWVNEQRGLPRLLLQPSVS